VHRIKTQVEALNAKRLVIDSLNGLELALSPSFRADFRDSLFRIVGQLTGGGTSTLITVEVAESFDELKFSPHEVSFLAQNIVLLRYVELAGTLQKVIAVVKMRRSEHSRDLRRYEITTSGFQIDGALRGYRGVLTGIPQPAVPNLVGLVEDERAVLASLVNGDAAQAALEAATGIPPEGIASALARLVSLHYVVRSGDGDAAVYRVVPRWTET
jgi:circadian clock protein KaiC